MSVDSLRVRLADVTGSGDKGPNGWLPDPMADRWDSPEGIVAFYSTSVAVAEAAKQYYAKPPYRYGEGLPRTLRQDLRDLTVPEVVFLAAASQRLAKSSAVPSTFLQEILAVQAENRIAQRGLLGRLAVAFLRLADL